MMSSVSAWFKSWLSHPYGKGATWTDYLASAIVLLIVLWGIWKIIAEVRTAA